MSTFDTPQAYDPFNRAGIDPNDKFAPFFGPPRYPYKTSAYDKNAQATHNLPEAYVGQNLYLGMTVVNMVRAADDWYNVVSPIIQTDQQKVSWDIWTFNEHFMDFEPEQGIPRLVTSQKNRRTESFERRGLAAMFEHGFMETEEGITHYLLTLRQIADAWIETKNFGVLYALRRAKDFARDWFRKHGYHRDQENRLRDHLENERDLFAIAQKEEFGMEKLNSNITELMGQYKGVADTWILPPQLSIYLRYRPEKAYYNLAGPIGPDRVNNGPSGRTTINNDPKRKIQEREEGPLALGVGNNVYLTRMYHVDRTGPIDPMRRLTQIGGYNYMGQEGLIPDDIKDFRTDHLSIVVYDQDRDEWAKITVQDAIKNSPAFDDKGALAKPKNPKNPAHAQNFLMKKGQNGGFKPIAKFGEIRPKFVSADWWNVANAKLKDTPFTNAEGTALTDKINSRIPQNPLQRQQEVQGRFEEELATLTNLHDTVKVNTELKNNSAAILGQFNNKSVDYDTAFAQMKDSLLDGENHKQTVAKGKKQLQRRITQLTNDHADRIGALAPDRQPGRDMYAGYGDAANNGAGVYGSIPVTRDRCLKLANANVPLPFNFLLLRPHKQFDMALGIKMQGQGGACNTYIGHTDFQLMDDAKNKTHFGHFTAYSGTVVHHPMNVYIAYDIFMNRAMGGGGVTPLEPEAMRTRRRRDGSMVYAILPQAETRKLLPNPLDAAGQFYSHNDAGWVDGTPSELQHYTTAAFYNEHFGWYRAHGDGMEIMEPQAAMRAAAINRICWSDHQFDYNKKTDTFDKPRINTGHLGADIYPGVRSVYNGKPTSFKKTKYHERLAY